MATKTKTRRNATPLADTPRTAFRATIKVSQAELAAACRFILPAIDTESSRYALGCAQLTFDDQGRPVLTTTDGRRAHVATLTEPAEIVGEAPTFRQTDHTRRQCLIPKAIVSELAKMPQAKNSPDWGQMTFRVNSGGLSFTYHRGNRAPVVRATRFETGRFPRVWEVIQTGYNKTGELRGPAHAFRDWLNPEPRITFEVSTDRPCATQHFRPTLSITAEGTIADMFQGAWIRDAIAELAGDVALTQYGPQSGFHITAQNRHAVIMPLHKDR